MDDDDEVSYYSSFEILFHSEKITFKSQLPRAAYTCAPLEPQTRSFFKNIFNESSTRPISSSF